MDDTSPRIGPATKRPNACQDIVCNRPPPRLRIAHFIHRYPPALGGSEAYFARLSGSLAGLGHRVTVFTTTALDLTAFWSRQGRCLPPGQTSESGVEVRRYPLCRLPGQRYLLKALSLLPWPAWQAWTTWCSPVSWPLWRAADRPSETFDVVHATALPYTWPMLCAHRLARRLGVPFMLTPFVHLGDLDDPHDRVRRAFLRPAMRYLLGLADHLFVQTEGERQALLDLGIPEERLVLQGMGIVPEECTGGDRERTRREWGIGPDEIVIGHLANLSPEKGTIDLLCAAQRGWERGGRFRVVLAGSEMPAFQRFWRGYVGKERVRLLGSLSEEQKRDFFAGLDVFALPSRVDSFGLVLLEAWANSLPVIAYRAGGLPWVVRDEEDGLLVRCGDLDGLASALLRLTAGEDRRRMGEAGRQRVLSELTWEQSFRVIKAVVETPVIRSGDW
jgi:glycosyltransferase involved in cell wall biosynthesis